MNSCKQHPRADYHHPVEERKSDNDYCTPQWCPLKYHISKNNRRYKTHQPLAKKSGSITELDITSSASPITTPNATVSNTALFPV